MPVAVPAPTENEPIALRPQDSWRAENSFRLGLLSLLLTFFTGIPAILFGLGALYEIRRSGGKFIGRRWAFAGIGTGLVGSCLGALAICYAVERLQESYARVD